MMSLLVLSLLFPLVQGQKTLEVLVGVQGSFYDPATISAELNDTIMFIFGGDVHDVTQSTFENPCTPLLGGFSSGFAGRGSNFSEATPVWNLQITNVSEPLWFFCAATVPSSHCAEGMVGVINPPSIDMYNTFVSAAKATKPTQASVSFVSGGQAFGAIATASPTPSSFPTSSIASSATFSSSFSPTPVTSPTGSTFLPTPVTTNAFSSSASTTNSHVGAIAGGAAAGTIFAVSAFLFLVLYLRYRKKRTRVRSGMGFRYGGDGGNGIVDGSLPGTGASDQSFKYPGLGGGGGPGGDVPMNSGSSEPVISTRRMFSGNAPSGGSPSTSYDTPHIGHPPAAGYNRHFNANAGVGTSASAMGGKGKLETGEPELEQVSRSMSYSGTPMKPIRPLPSIERLVGLKEDGQDSYQYQHQRQHQRQREHQYQYQPHPYANQSQSQQEDEYDTASTTTTMNINTLAKEVAAVLMHGHGQGKHPAHAIDRGVDQSGAKYLSESERERERENEHGRMRYLQDESSIRSSSPPHYQSHSSYE